MSMNSSSLKPPSTEEPTSQGSRDEQIAVLKSHEAEDACREQNHTQTCAPKADGQWWHVNKGGFPIPKETWERMWQHITDTHPNGADITESIRGKPLKRVRYH